MPSSFFFFWRFWTGLVRVFVAAKVVVDLRVVLLLVVFAWHPLSEAGKTARVVVQVRVQDLVADITAGLVPSAFLSPQRAPPGPRCCL